NPRLEALLQHHALPNRVVRPLVEVQKRMRGLDHGAMPTVMALGNRMVFHEIGWTMVTFLEWIETQTARDDDAWETFRAQIKPFESTDFFRPGYPEWLRDGGGAYYDAW